MNAPFFKPIPKWDMDKAKKFLDENALDAYQLIDVRQPEEFERGHLPGAKLIPLSELAQRTSEIQQDKPALVYCHSGGRAGNGVALLNQAGFDNAFSIGGISQWNGLTAVGPPEAGMAWFDEARKPEEYVALACILEDGARLFYLELADQFPEIKEIATGLAKGEQQHQATLRKLHQEITGSDADPILPSGEAADMMEGGVKKSEAMAWVRDRQAADVLEFAIAMEANAYDRYIRVGQGLGGQAQRVFKELAEAEKIHLNELMAAFQQRLG